LNPEIEFFFESLPEEKRVLALHLREFLLSVSDEIHESIKWGNLTFSKGKTHLIFIYTYKSVSYLNIGFTKATSLEDPLNLFIGSGKGMRHVKVKSMNEINYKQLKSWLMQSLQL